MKLKRIISLLIIFTCVCAHAQVSGVVLDDRGEPMIGANVYWAGTSKGVASNINGEFTIMPVKGNRTLVISFVGYRTQAGCAEEPHFGI